MPPDARRSTRCRTGRSFKTAAEIAAGSVNTPVVLVCFDLLPFCRPQPGRRALPRSAPLLAQCLLPSRHLQLVHVSENAEQLYAAGPEPGIRRHHRQAPRQRLPGRPALARWLKIKAARSAEFVIGGYTRGQGARSRWAPCCSASGRQVAALRRTRRLRSQRRSHRRTAAARRETQTPQLAVRPIRRRCIGPRTG